ncbi:MAG: ABC transporter ATP-binding protein [Chloroflexota bacterium]
MSNQPVLDVRNLTKHFSLGGEKSFGRGQHRVVHAVDDVSFVLRNREVLALVGESGSGKSTIARLLARLYAPTAGQALFRGEDIFALNGRTRMRHYRSQMQMVFQDPFGSLNPVKTAAYHIERPLKIHHKVRGRTELRDEVWKLLRTVGLTPEREMAAKLPHEMSGGQRQRVSFARALAVNPSVILADEPVSMLDVSIRMGILNLMADLRDDRGLSLLYITHDLASARYLADRTMVLYAGQVMESGTSRAVMSDPLHPYTQLLLSAVPEPKSALVNRRVAVTGEVASGINPGPGCRFAARCPRVMDVCRAHTPTLTEAQPGHWVRCHLYTPAGAVTPARAV